MTRPFSFSAKNSVHLGGRATLATNTPEWYVVLSSPPLYPYRGQTRAVHARFHMANPRLTPRTSLVSRSRTINSPPAIPISRSCGRLSPRHVNPYLESARSLNFNFMDLLD